MKTPSPTPDAILQTAFGFWNSKVLLTAVTFDLFSTLGQHRLTGPEIARKLDLHPRGVADFLDALMAMKFLERQGDGVDALADFEKWCREVGFTRFEVIRLAGPSSAAIAYK